MKKAQQTETSTFLDDLVQLERTTMDAEACVSQALVCLKEAEDNPNMKHYWMAKSILWLQQASDAWKHAAATKSQVEAK